MQGFERAPIAGSAILASVLTGLKEAFDEWGANPEPIFEAARLDPRAASHPNRPISLKSYCALLEAAAEATGDDAFGLRLGQRSVPADLGLVGYLASASADLATALDEAIALFPYHQQASELSLARTQGRVRLGYRICDGAIVRRRQNAEFMLAVLCNLFRLCHGRGWGPEEVHFEHVEPADRRAHEAAFGAPVYFGQRINAIVFQAADLDRAMPTADPKLATLLRHSLTALGISPECHQSITEQVRNHILSELPDDNPTLEKTADALNVPAWTIQRRLAETGTTFSEMVESTRKELAVSYLGQPHLPLTEIAFLLGYSELSAFSRAFQRWTGASPRAYRKAMVRAPLHGAGPGPAAALHAPV